jgi:adenine phosphoribosyltransferase
MYVNYEDFIRSIPNFPEEGILFRDITPLLNDHEVYSKAVRDMAAPYLNKKIDAVAAIESRGYLFGAPVANILGVPLVTIRKPGKLPFTTYKASYKLEYGESTLEIHTDSFNKNANVLLVDDLIATGGTIIAAIQLIEKAGGKVSGISVLIELAELEGRNLLADYKLNTLITYADDKDQLNLL